MTCSRPRRPSKSADWWIAIAICVGTYGLIFLGFALAHGTVQ
jgi:hypothetical protein